MKRQQSAAKRNWRNFWRRDRCLKMRSAAGLPAGICFPCYFGSALKNTGVEEFMRGLEEYTLEPVYPDEFGAKIFKIVRDNQGERLTYMKITGGVLHVKDRIGEEKVNQLRLYSGDKYEAVSEGTGGYDLCGNGTFAHETGRGAWSL